MTKVEKITEYISKLFELYHMSTYGFFQDYDEEGDASVDIPLFPYGRVDNETLERLSINFGISKEEILSRDEAAAKRYWDKYPFFSLYEEYMRMWKWNQNYKDREPTAEEFLINAIFGYKRGIPIRVRHNYKDIRERLIKQLKEIEQFLPGTYHEGAEIENLHAWTDVLFSFPRCGEMLRAFVQIVERTKDLFFMALKSELPEEDARELDFLASWLNAVDVVSPSTLITYDNVRFYREAYLEEASDDFFFYVKIKSLFIATCPWRCKEFFDDEMLAKKIVYIFPQAKAKMREFVLRTTKIHCVFSWSDTGETESVYIDKTRSETYGWGKSICALKKATKSVSRGGFEAPNRTEIYDVSKSMPRMLRRIDIKKGGNK